ncbi:MAG: dienelactone hydrolase family protein [Balneolaceae bacterium]|nr:dienelactone hydrolase family protein [Balneolaceae bacterium]
MKSLISFLMLVLVMGVGCSKKEKAYEDRMMEEHAEDKPVANKAWYEPEAPVDTQSVVYAKIDGKQVNGYLAQPEGAPGDAPGIIVIHEWWGLNDNVKMMTRRIAAEGYTALAVDLYKGQVAESPEDARTYMSGVMDDMSASTENLKAAYQYLDEQHKASKVGTIGWCFGGGMSLTAALTLPAKIDLAVIYYGRLVTDKDQLRLLEMPVIGFFGGADQGIPVATVKEFETALDSAGVENEIYIYKNAGHAFANPSGNNYQKAAAEDAWYKTVEFLDYYLTDPLK